MSHRVAFNTVTLHFTCSCTSSRYLLRSGRCPRRVRCRTATAKKRLVNVCHAKRPREEKSKTTKKGAAKLTLSNHTEFATQCFAWVGISRACRVNAEEEKLMSRGHSARAKNARTQRKTLYDDTSTLVAALGSE